MSDNLREKLVADVIHTKNLVNAELREENERLLAANRDLQMWFDDARDTAEKLQARVAMLEPIVKELADDLESTVSNIKLNALNRWMGK